MSLIGQEKFNHQYCLQSTGLRSGIGKGIDPTQQQHILLLSSQFLSYGPQPTSFHPYSSWGWFEQEAHVPPYFRPHYIAYATSRYSDRSSSCKDCFDQNRSGAQPKKKVVKEVYHVKNDGRKNKSCETGLPCEEWWLQEQNFISEFDYWKADYIAKKSGYWWQRSGKSSINILDAKSEQKNVIVPKIKKYFPQSKKEIKLRCSLRLPKWQENKLQKLSAEKLKEMGLAWVPKRSFQAQKDDA